jgi:hypothetical protein
MVGIESTEEVLASIELLLRHQSTVYYVDDRKSPKEGLPFLRSTYLVVDISGEKNSGLFRLGLYNIFHLQGRSYNIDASTS